MFTPKLYSVAPTRSSGNVGLAIQRRVLVFTSEWHWKPAGVEHLRSQLSSLLAEANIPFLLRWEEASACFIVECVSGETDAVARNFLRVHQSIVDVECARNDSEDSEDDDAASDSDSSTGWGEKQGVSSDKIMLRSEWKKEAQGESTPNSQPQPAPSPGPSVSPHQFPRIHHIFFSEGNPDFQVVLRNILDVRKRYFESTLLDNYQTTLYDFVYVKNNSPLDDGALAQAITARCTLPDYKRNLYTAVKESKIKCATREDDIALPNRNWAEFVYQQQGSVDPLLRIKQGNPPVSKVVPVVPQSSATPEPTPQAVPVGKPASVIDKWASELPPTVISRQNAPSAPSQKKPVWDGYQPYGEDVKPVVPKVESIILANRRVVSASATTLPSQKTVTSPQQRSAVLPPHLRQASQQQPQGQFQAIPTGRRTPPHLRVPNRPLQASQPAQSSQSAGPSQSRQTAQMRNLLDDSSVINIPSLMDSSPVMVPSTSSRSVQPFGDLISFDDSAVVVEPSRGTQQLIDAFSSVQEVQQQDDEVSTRQFRNTMNQKAPKPGRGRQNDSSSSFAGRLPLPSPPRQKSSSSKQVLFPELSSAGPDFVDILELVQASGFKGDIRVQADFGRILMKNLPRQFVAKKDSDKSYKRDFLSESVIQHAAQNTFTKILTSVPQDVHFLVELKEESGARMWEAKPFTWNVVYEFRYILIATGEAVNIEMDAETMQCTVTTIEENFGSIYVHGIKRHWDARLTVNGRIDISEQHTELVDAIKKSLFVPADARSPQFRFEVGPNISDIYELDVIRTHRITKFRSTQNGSILNVREVEELGILFKSAAADDSYVTVFKADRKAVRSNPLDLDMWFESFITSPEVDEKLKQSWTSQDIKAMNATDQILQPACLMIQQMDGVGFYNVNGVTGARPARDPSPPPPEPEQFW